MGVHIQVKAKSNYNFPESWAFTLILSPITRGQSQASIYLNFSWLRQLNILDSFKMPDYLHTQTGVIWDMWAKIGTSVDGGRTEEKSRCARCVHLLGSHKAKWLLWSVNRFPMGAQPDVKNKYLQSLKILIIFTLRWFSPNFWFCPQIQTEFWTWNKILFDFR